MNPVADDSPTPGEGPSVIFVNRAYPPVPGATGELLAELAAELARHRWCVTVVTTRNAPDAPRSSEENGVHVERVGGLAFTRASHWRRALSYLTLYPALLWRVLRLPRADVLVLLTDPPLQLVLGPFIKFFKRVRLMHWAQDLYPEVAEQLGVIQERGLPARCLRRLSTVALRRCDRVIAVGACMKARMITRGIAAEKVEVIPNWANTAEIQPVPQESNAFRREHGLAGRFVAMYSGNFGLAHTFDAILDAAGVLQAQLPQVLFLFCGDGPRLASVQEQAVSRGLNNVRFLPFQPRGQLARSLGAADVHLVSMRDDLCGVVVPSKVYGALAAGRPCVFLGPRESEAAELIVKHRCGSVLPRATGAALADCLGKWASSPDELAAAGARALAFARGAGLSAAVAEWERLLKTLV